MTGFDDFAANLLFGGKKPEKKTISEPVAPAVKTPHKKEPPVKVKSITEILLNSLGDTQSAPQVVEIGEVVYIGDGICKVKGLSNVGIDDVVRIKTSSSDVLALVLGLANDLTETVVLGDFFRIRKGDVVLATSKSLSVPVGDSILGRVISPIGDVLDGQGALRGTKHMVVERPAPYVYMREPIVQGFKTGFLVIDSIIPLGRGQRELVVGDKKTGKSRLLADIICNLKNENMVCVYVAIGAQKVKVKSFVKYLKDHNALDYTAIVLATSDDPPSLNYLAPYSGTSIAEYFCDKGKDALVIFDDLSKHAKSYRQMSLLLKRSPGRDAYPGDIFYLHSRLLERSSKLAKEYGGGSITALPVCETQNGDISEYITTNLMSITDGHMYLDGQLMHDGVFPAVNSGSSVSRIGSGVQPVLLRKIGALAGQQLARYNEVKSYETINTAITEETEREINRGKRLLEIFTQPSGINYSLAEESILLQLVTSGNLDYVENAVVAKLKVEIVEYFRKHFDSYQKLNAACESKSKEDEEVSKNLADEFIKDYLAETKSEAANALREAISPETNPREKVEAVKEVIKEVNATNQDVSKPAEPGSPQNPAAPNRPTASVQTSTPAEFKENSNPPIQPKDEEKK